MEWELSVEAPVEVVEESATLAMSGEPSTAGRESEIGVPVVKAAGGGV